MTKKIKNTLFVFALFICCNAFAANKDILLNGTWKVAISDNAPQEYASTVVVPGVITMAKPILRNGLDGIDLKPIDYNYVWYKYEFDLNEKEKFSTATLKIRAKYNAMVILNGKNVGFDNHTTYSHGEFDASNAINLNGHNILLVRVGSWNTSSEPSKDNSSEWWRNSRAPGIWDDVILQLEDQIAIKHVKVLPDVKNGRTNVTVKITNRENKPRTFNLNAAIEDENKKIEQQNLVVKIEAHSTLEKKISLNSSKLKTWSAGIEGTPKLYNLSVTLFQENKKAKTVSEAHVILSMKNTVFGYRQIEVSGRDVLINGQKVLFRAENIAFPRALNRWADVMFDENWIRHFLRTAIHEYNFNYLRFHLGHAYSKWYKIADEEGIMLQDEWRYMHDNEPEGQHKKDAVIEFTRWVEQNVNHPSIVAWDQENEGNVRLEDLKAALRDYDPTRLWGEDDFDAKHVYEYSENIVKDLNYDISQQKPSTVLESCRLWTNEFGLLEPRENFKTSRTASAWGLYYYTKEDIARLLTDIHTDLGTYYRSQRLQAWAPFALLSGCVNGQNFFVGNIVDSLRPQENLLALKKLNEPFGTSIDMLQAREWYKDKKRYTPGGEYSPKIFVWNDYPEQKSATLAVELLNTEGNKISSVSASVTVPSGQSIRVDNLKLILPTASGAYTLIPSLTLNDGSVIAGAQRRLMVAADNYIPDEMLAFGGRSKPVAHSYSILEHFTGCPIPDSTQQRIAKEINGGSVDKVEVLGDASDKKYKIQYTVYNDAKSYKLITTVFDETGRPISSSYSDALIFVSLPVLIKDAIIKAIEAVPVDESKIIRATQNGDTIYEISLIGKNEKYRLNITDNGELKSKKVLKGN